ncbi:conserved hypothetical protein [Vibrio crassostreae]|nr:conserved hypothetical protein [Vibrio crassostreae]CAK2596130.1 conserved hypothetical protein [Vibrio crassostreae]CAK2611010.1 conserved hypothetical protein [Vibrio crassostreae]CAK2652357.1 conserved hypothetical protein [Vibrio crassostreae]CAK2746563.1 conserved hypothetical protein [Vibrio crassostreae]
MKPIEFRGVVYKSLSSFFIENKHLINCSKPTLTIRLNEGMDIEEAIVASKKKTGTTFIEPQLIEGVIYKTIKEIAEAYKVNFNTMFKRYSRGKRGEDLVKKTERKDYVEESKVISKKKYIPDSAKAIEYEGVVYTSEKNICAVFNVDRATFRVRRKRGLTIGQALGQEPTVDGRTTTAKVKKHEYQGKEYTIPALSKAFGINESTIRDRLNRGATVEQALSKEKIDRGILIPQRNVPTKKRSHNVPVMVVDGKTYSSYKALADEYGLKQYVVRQRIVDYGWTPEDAVKLEGKHKSFIVDGKVFPTLQDAAKEYGIKIETLRGRREIGWTPRQIVGLDIAPHLTVYKWDGKEFGTVRDVAQYVGMSEKLLSSRLTRMTLADAIELGNKRVVNSGRYNMTILERDEELANTPSFLYFLEMIVDERLAYKVGITTTTVAERMSSERGVLWEEIAVGNGTLMECFKLEQAIHELMEDKNIKDIDGSIMDGYTELFDFNDSDVESIKELIAELL